MYNKIEYPKMVYKEGVNLIVENVEEHKAAWDKGYRGAAGHPTENVKPQALLDYEAQLEAREPVEVAAPVPGRPAEIPPDAITSSPEMPDPVNISDDTEEPEAPEADLTFDGDALTVAEPKYPLGIPEEPEDEEKPEDEAPPTEEELQEAFEAAHPRKKAIFNGWETKAYTKWKKAHGYE